MENELREVGILKDERYKGGTVNAVRWKQVRLY